LRFDAARAAGIDVVVGAQVGETSILTSAGLTAAHAAGDLLVAQQGAFGTHLLARDVCDPPLIFGAGGVLDAAVPPSLKRPAFGFAVIIKAKVRFTARFLPGEKYRSGRNGGLESVLSGKLYSDHAIGIAVFVVVLDLAHQLPTQVGHRGKDAASRDIAFDV
jgi:hypothetical protein